MTCSLLQVEESYSCTWSSVCATLLSWATSDVYTKQELEFFSFECQSLDSIIIKISTDIDLLEYIIGYWVGRLKFHSKTSQEAETVTCWCEYSCCVWCRMSLLRPGIVKQHKNSNSNSVMWSRLINPSGEELSVPTDRSVCIQFSWV